MDFHFNWTSVAIYGLIGALIAVGLQKGVKGKPAELRDGTMVLKPSVFFAIVGYGVPTVMILLLGSLAVILNEPSLLPLFAGLIGFFVLLAIPSVLTSRLVLTATDTAVSFKGATGKITEMKWSEIDSITCSKTTGHLTLKAGEQVIKIKFLFKGYSGFIRFLKTRVDMQKYRDVFEILDKKSAKPDGFRQHCA